MFAITLDFSEFERKVDLTREALRRDLATATRKAADSGVRQAKRGRFQDRTGKLRATINTTALGWSRDAFWMQIHCPAEYAHFVDLGTKPHDIPKERRPPGKALQFWWEREQIWFTGYHVNHPGTQPTHFFTDAIVATKKMLHAELSAEFVNVRSVWR